MFRHLITLIPREKILCIAAGSITQEASSYTLEGTGVTLVNGDVLLQHPSKGKNGWMTVEERHKYIAQSCKLMSLFLGREFLIDKLSWNRLDLVYGICGSMELRWWDEHVDITAGGEVAYVTDLINEKINECVREEEESTRRKEERMRKKAREEEESTRKEEERSWMKDFITREEEGIKRRKEERTRKKEECARKKEERERKKEEKLARKEKCAIMLEEELSRLRESIRKRLCTHDFTATSSQITP
jgi:hypothetical protein